MKRRRESFPTIKERLAQTKQLDLALAATELQEEFAEKMVMTKLDWPAVASKSGRSLKILLVLPTRQETEGLCAVLKHKFSGQKVSEISRLPDDDGVITCQSVSESTALCVRVLQDQQVEELTYRYGRWKHFSVYIQLWKDLFWNYCIPAIHPHMDLKISFGEIEVQVSEVHLASNRFLSVDETMIQN